MTNIRKIILFIGLFALLTGCGKEEPEANPESPVIEGETTTENGSTAEPSPFISPEQ